MHPSLGECRALSRGQAIRVVTAFWKLRTTSRDGNRGTGQLSVQIQAGRGGGMMGTAKPLVSHLALSPPS